MSEEAHCKMFSWSKGGFLDQNMDSKALKFREENADQIACNVALQRLMQFIIEMAIIVDRFILVPIN